MMRQDRLVSAAVLLAGTGLAAVVQRAVARFLAESRHPVGGVDPDGNPRTVPVRVGGLVVWHSEAEWERYWKGIDREAAELLRDE